MSPLQVLVIFVAGLPAFLAEATTVFTHSAVLDTQGKFRLRWFFDEASITFEATAETRGYVALGFSPNGGMANSDIVIGWVEDGRAELEDRYAHEKSQPVLDAKQDWTLHEAQENGTHTTMRFSRKLQTCDSSDRDIQKGTTRVIWAYHPDDPDPGRGPLYHESRRGTSSLNLLDPPAPPQWDSPEDVLTFDALTDNVHVPPRDTTYWCTALRMPPMDRKHHIIKMEAIIQPGHERLVHHIVLFQCKHDGNESLSHLSSPRCGSVRRSLDCGRTRFLVAWAVGGNDLYLPEDVGLPVGDDDGNVLVLQIHYDNPNLRDDLYDSSGIRIHYTPVLRTHDGGVLQIGAEVSPTMMIPPGADRFNVYAYCSSSCLQEVHVCFVFGNACMAILATFPIHLGRSIRDRHYRNGKELKPINGNDAYDFNYQQTTYLKPYVKLLPGDALVLECGYETKGRHNMTYGGRGTWEEMCMDFLLYYPKIDLDGCGSEPNAQDLAAFFGVHNFTYTYHYDVIITGPEDHPFVNKSLFEAAHAHGWTEDEIRTFEEHNRHMPHRMVCEAKAHFQAHEQLEDPPTFEPLIEPTDNPCEEDTNSRANLLSTSQAFTVSLICIVPTVLAWI
ncbi:PREDICTED: DBH-like monooxygenase protein 1 homolog [Branchiostoma belcheri]|uniref:DBH-like monooxygenase protein 1 homolog n=1 Tax=Branchiostoma belcheri TaxID=7741 RepID=A0A6P4YUP2_BRABE|nr:PREDICTED: DBH-like monooxygenase protein 1 homolog [Branchiostoma belcheri]